jgi:hypothetical protein
MRFFTRLFLWATPVILAGCTNAGQERRTTKNPGIIFPDYRIWSEEGKENVTCLLQFRTGGPDGAAVLLKEPALIELDGEKVAPDSTRLTGAFYEVIKPAEEFKGKHTIVYTDAGMEQHQTEFEFLPFDLVNEVPEKVHRKSFTIQLAYFPEERTPVHIMLTDTAFSTNDVNEIVDAVDGKIEITAAMLDKLKAGPVVLEIFKESTNPVAGVPGRIWVSYGLRREFELE